MIVYKFGGIFKLFVFKIQQNNKNRLRKNSYLTSEYIMK